MSGSYSMSDKDKATLRSNLTFILQNMMPQSVMDYLYEKGIFSKSEYDEINAKQTATDKNRKIVMSLRQKGRDAFKTFIICLMESEQQPVAMELDSYGYVSEWLATKHIPSTVAETIRPSSSTGVQATPKSPIGSLILGFDVFSINEEEQKDIIRDTENVYRMTRKVRGRVVIISNGTFHDKPVRPGSDTDNTNLRKLFEKLQFDVFVEKKKKAQEILDLIQQEATDTSNNEKSDCFILFVLSHGGVSSDNRDYILGSDDKRVYIESDIVKPFYGDKCPSLKDKPKLFFIHACRVISDDKADCVDASPDTNAKQAMPKQMSVVEPDIMEKDDTFCIYSTVKGHASYSHGEQGSFFVRQIVKVFAKYAHSHSLLQMLVKVNNKLKEDNYISEVHFTAGKEFYFFPGYSLE